MTELKPKIMVVDNEPAIVELLTRFLTKKNYEVISFTSGKEALAYLSAKGAAPAGGQGSASGGKTNEVNLLLIDMAVSEMSRRSGIPIESGESGSGIELIKATKELKPNLPILLMFGSCDSEKMNEMTKLGISDYIAKPFQLNSLEKSIELRLSARPDSDIIVSARGGSPPDGRAGRGASEY